MARALPSHLPAEPPFYRCVQCRDFESPLRVEPYLRSKDDFSIWVTNWRKGVTDFVCWHCANHWARDDRKDRQATGSQCDWQSYEFLKLEHSKRLNVDPDQVSVECSRR